MNYRLIVNTVLNLHLKQIWYQFWYRINKPKYTNKIFSGKANVVLSCFSLKENILEECNFTFLNISDCFSSWNNTSHGMLWAYNLNYMDYLLEMPFEEGARWIDKFIDEINTNKVGLDSYPIALRGINWIKFIAKYNQQINSSKRAKWNNSLYSQYILLSKKLEYHLLGNHLLEDAYSLFIGSIYFEDKKLYNRAYKLIKNELEEQILPDGAHYEQSAMYHCILLDRLLDCYNMSINNLRFESQNEINTFLKSKAELMLGHLESIIYADGSIPLMNDAAYGIAPKPDEIFKYADQLSLSHRKILLKECGYRKLINPKFEALIDVGNITASYQPGHSHADTFNYELRIDGKPFIIDTGISTYDKTPRRQYERSTIAHNTVSIDDENSSEVWGGFRVGKRAKVIIITDTNSYIKAEHNGYSKVHNRKFLIDNDFTIIDGIDSAAQTYIHFAPEIKILNYNVTQITTSVASITINGANKIEIIEEQASNCYNQFKPIQVAKISFSKHIKYSIK